MLRIKNRLLEILRVVGLICVGAGLMEPFLTHGIIGGSDAIKYSNGVADFVTQVRTGVFPVWIGQSEFAFFGGEFPPRFAPYLQHEAALIDLLTGHRLALFFVLNLALAVSLVGGIVVCYLCLRNVTPERPWAAFALAILYGSCPGVIGLAYAQDLYMSFSTLPFLPVVFLGIYWSFERNDALSRLFIAGGLAGAWLAHPPIAMWLGFVTTATQCVRIWQKGYGKKTLLLDFGTIGLFFVLAGYSFVAAKSVASQWWMPSVNLKELLFQVKQAFPGSLMPLPREVPLETLQLGYSLSAILVLSIAAGLMWRREPLQITFAAIGIALCAAIIPVPLLTTTFWHAVPQAVLVVTNIWPMQRIFVIVALCAVFGCAFTLRHTSNFGRAANRTFGLFLLAAVGWSGVQCSHFIAAAIRTAPSFARSAQSQRPENLVLAASTYGVTALPPRYASLGVMDPGLENHLLDSTKRFLLESASDRIEPGFGPGPKMKTERRLLEGRFGGILNANPGILDMTPSLTIKPGQRYLLAIEFLDHDYTGVLIIHGNQFSREYRLPLSGESRAFGSGSESSNVIPLWTTSDEPEVLQLQFVPMAAGHTPLEYVPFANYELRPYKNADLPITVESIIPYKATVRCKESVFLETPRLFLPGYAATVDGEPIATEISPDGYVVVPLKSGIHKVTLEYHPPLMLRLSYWTGIVGWLGLFLAWPLVKRKQE